MTEVAEETQPAMTYPTEQQYSRWKDCAEERDMSVSEFMQAMIEMGVKFDQGFATHPTSDETIEELRLQRNDLKEELERARNRIKQLEKRLHRTERREIREFVAQNDGVTHAEIVQHLIDTIPSRTLEHLEALEGRSISVIDDEYHAVSDGEKVVSEG